MMVRKTCRGKGMNESDGGGWGGEEGEERRDGLELEEDAGDEKGLGEIGF
jgi:hypothetical protein